MDTKEAFNNLVENHVDLNSDRKQKIKEKIETIKSFIKNSDEFKDIYKDLLPQGSYRQDTIIKPAKDDKEFDVDVLLVLEEVGSWEPKDYINNLASIFEKSDRYKDIIDKRGKTRCVTLNYVGDFHMDIVPCIEISDGYLIMNRDENKTEKTDGDGYAQWFDKQNMSANNHLVNVVKLIKYLRDKNEDFDTKSIIITTLAGMIVPSQNGYVNLPESFTTILSGLNYFLTELQDPPSIENPSMPGENFDRHWKNDIAGFKKLKDALDKYSGIANQAINLTGEEAIQKWSELFGDGFAINVKDTEKSILESGLSEFSLGDISHCQSVTAIPGCLQEKLDPLIRVKISGCLYSRDGSRKFRGIKCNARIGSDALIKYEAGTNIKEPYEIYWQVVNTGKHAESMMGGLRGDFFLARLSSGERSSNKHINWERSLYTGKHWIECFIVKDNYCITRSGRFYVNIKNPKF